jgi:methylated-DNA-protein-cysteine methyltransferase related protein
MASSPGQIRLKADILALVARLPVGRLATHGALARHLGVAPRHIVQVLAALDAADVARVPWWRVVADGGAIGQHKRRAEQMQRLRDDGVPVAPAGIAQELDARRINDFSKAAVAIVRAPDESGGTPVARSRGMKSHAGLPSIGVQPRSRS